MKSQKKPGPEIKDFCDELVPRRKTSTHSIPTKAKHKHNFEPCIIEYTGEKYDSQKGFADIVCSRISGYCTLCGKRGDSGRAIMQHVPKKIVHAGKVITCSVLEYTDEAKLQLDPNTRTWPTFWVDDFWKQKYVQLSNKRNNAKEEKENEQEVADCGRYAKRLCDGAVGKLGSS